MKKLVKISALLSASLLAAPTAMAAPILIDDFDIFQSVVDAPFPGEVNASVVVNATLFGGSRFLQVANTPAGGGDGSTLRSTGVGNTPQVTPASSLSFTTLNGNSGIARVVYDGRTNTANPTAAGPGFAPLDLSDGGSNASFFFNVLTDTSNLNGAVFTTTVTSSLLIGDLPGLADDFSATFSEILDPATFSPFTGFSNFAGVDFTRVTSLAFELDSTNVIDPITGLPNNGFDAGIGSFSAIPLPMTALLLLGGLGGLAGVSSFSKRRRKA